MSKQEFIEQLRRNLASINDYTFVNDTIAYYENYIESQIRMGRTEEEVMKELGDPRLIAKSIKASHSKEDRDESVYREYDGYDEDSRGNKENRSVFHINGHRMVLPTWLLKIIVVLVIIVVLFLGFTILRWISPFIFMGFFFYMIYKLISGNGRW